MEGTPNFNKILKNLWRRKCIRFRNASFFQSLLCKARFTIATKTRQFKGCEKRWKVDQVQLLLFIAGVFVAANSVLSFTFAGRLNLQRFSRQYESGLMQLLDCCAICKGSSYKKKYITFFIINQMLNIFLFNNFFKKSSIF